MDHEFRPTTIDELFGQQHLTGLLQSYVKNPEGMPKSILFCGPYGTGKTTVARILANLLVTQPRDLIEINAAETRGIDDARSWVEFSRAAAWGSNRVYIIDELQQMTKPAQSALLKPIEEPPAHVFFFLCTTDPGKILETIRSRCSLLEFKPFEEADTLALVEHLSKGQVKPELARVIHRKSGGHARDAMKLVNMVLKGGITTENELEDEVVGAGDVDYAVNQLINPSGLTKAQYKKMVEVMLSDPDRTFWVLGDRLDQEVVNGNLAVMQRYHDLVGLQALVSDYKISAKRMILAAVAKFYGD